MITSFGTTRAGDAVQKITLSAGDLTVSLLTLGAILQSVRLQSTAHDLTLGSSDISAYDGGPMTHFGAIMGPVANRIRDAKATLKGQDHTFERNFLGKHVLHGGNAAFHHKVWTLKEATETRAVLTLDVPHGEGGFPGKRSVQAVFEVTSSATLTLTLMAQTDQPTWINLANHSYWNLDGSPTFDGHRLHICADRYLPGTDEFLPTGEIAAVKATPFDFQHAVQCHPQIPTPLDNNFCLADQRRDLTPAATLWGQTGLWMKMSTTEPGLQVYDGRAQTTAPYAGHQGHPYEAYPGLALEAQGWPNAPKEPEFPSIVTTPDAPYKQVTSWQFGRDD